MPREFIQHGHPRSESDFDVLVGWNKDFNVQLGVSLGQAPFYMGVDDGFDHDRPADIDFIDWFYGSPDQNRDLGQALVSWLISPSPQDERKTVAEWIVWASQNISEREARDTGYYNLGHKILSLVKMQRTDIDGRDGLWVDLTRKAINNLIVALRKARDGAYGKDQ